MQVFKEQETDARVALSKIGSSFRIHRSGVHSVDCSMLKDTTWQHFRESVQVLRKEVIQPQVPLRLPCYDFTPIIEQTVGGSLPCGLRHRLQVHPTFVV